MNVAVIKTVLAGLCACLLLSCSSTRLTYNYLDWGIGWYLDDYLDLNGRQDDFYEQRLEALLQWHRREELVRYSAFIDQLKTDMQGPLSTALLHERYETLRQFFRDIMQRAAPDCTELLLWLDTAQRADFYAAMAKRQKKLEDKYLNETPQERSRRLCGRAEKSIKRFVGGLTAPQEAILAHWAAGLVPTQRLWLENRRTWQGVLKEVLESDLPVPEKQPRLQTLFVDPERLWAPAYRKAIGQNEAATLAMLAGLHATLTSKQRERLDEALGGMKDDFMSLSRQ